ncbi:hypothetical protein Ahy_A02g009031 [Arachis hypogaea]|uniref:Uncharacterized protein n=1 Tax=Arachis hypogaea TaxID=3818 RepID=A0A445EFQ2_ARAHY|nr:hypothetical protein Ahy_A02g009031 [Arachis hypogaea]
MVREIPNFCSTLRFCVVVESRDCHASVLLPPVSTIRLSSIVRENPASSSTETPLADDQGIYNRLTWWEQIDNEKQLTRNRKPITELENLKERIEELPPDIATGMNSMKTE